MTRFVRLAPSLAALCLLAATATTRAASLYGDGVGARARAMAGTGTAAANDPLSRAL